MSDFKSVRPGIHRSRSITNDEWARLKLPECDHPSAPGFPRLRPTLRPEYVHVGRFAGMGNLETEPASPRPFSGWQSALRESEFPTRGPPRSRLLHGSSIPASDPANTAPGGQSYIR